MTESKTLHWLTFDVKLELHEDVPEGYNENALAGVDDEADDDGRFRIWFKGITTIDAVVHETWHLFFIIMAFSDSHAVRFDELNRELYAYSFQHLFNMVHDNLTGMRLYRRLWDERSKEEK